MSEEEKVHRCSGCIHNEDDYMPACEGCRRKTNLMFNTPWEKPQYLSLEDKYTSVVSFGSTKVLKRSKS